MPENLRLHQHADALAVEAGGVEIARYVFAPDAPASEAPKPFFHPLRALDGAPVTVHRPWDHRWHKGLQMTLSHVEDQNFWGGPTFSDPAGYQWLDNLGVQRHERFSDVVGDGESVSWDEHLTWTTAAGADWFTETRRLAFHSVELPSADGAHGVWALDFDTTLVNVSGRTLRLGSPTTAGRPAAGYTGLFWRGPRAFTGAGVVSADGTTDAARIMGSRSDWLALRGQHDDVDGGATILFYAGRSSASTPVRWFVRSEPFACIAPSPAFDETVSLAPRDELTLSHRLVVVDRVLRDDELTRLAERLAPVVGAGAVGAGAVGAGAAGAESGARSAG